MTEGPQLAQRVTERGPSTQGWGGDNFLFSSTYYIRSFTLSDLTLMGHFGPLGSQAHTCHTGPHWVSSLTSCSGGLLITK